MNVKMQNSFFRCVLAQCVECQNTLLILMSSIQTDLTQQMKGMSSMKHVCANYTPGRGNLKFEHLGKVHRDSEYAVMIAETHLIAKGMGSFAFPCSSSYPWGRSKNLVMYYSNVRLYTSVLHYQECVCKNLLILQTQFLRLLSLWAWPSVLHWETLWLGKIFLLLLVLCQGML